VETNIVIFLEIARTLMVYMRVPKCFVLMQSLLLVT